MAVLNSAAEGNADATSVASAHSGATPKNSGGGIDNGIPVNQPFPQLRNNASPDSDAEPGTPSSSVATKTRVEADDDNDDDEDPAVAKPFLRTSSPDNMVPRPGPGDADLDDDDDDDEVDDEMDAASMDSNYDGSRDNSPGREGFGRGTTGKKTKNSAGGPGGGQTGGVDGGSGERRTATAHERLGHKMHKFTLYETASRYYIVGEDVTGRRFRVLKIDRTTSDDGELSITDDKIVYSQKEMTQLLDTIDDGNRGTGGIKLRCTLWGLLGFIRFTGPYYMMLITKKSTVAVIGGHVVYQIAGTELIPLTPGRRAEHGHGGGGGVSGAANTGGQHDASHGHAHHHSASNADEARFLAIFNHVNLAQAFYFSYSYDITHTLQHNITKEREALAAGRRWSSDEDHNTMFVWNSHLLQPAMAALASPFDWCRPITHGYIDQASIAIYGRTAYVAIIARRSRYFAGARFLKRGANDQGYVANDVETEQIVSEASTTSFHSPGRRLFANPQYTSYVQHRGSIPLYWTQENTGVTPKPPIELNLVDPFYSAAALHFDNLFDRYGAPIYVLNLVKARESTPRESKLLEELTRAIRYLNQFLPADKQIIHHAWDMSRANKSRDVNVIRVLESIAETVVATTGFFRNGDGTGKPVQEGDGRALEETNGSAPARVQNGVARTNCIDCLDRTNAAQFVIGKCALGHQLHALGILDEPSVAWETDAVNLFTHMYHDHGDTIAMQYGGSQLVNTMETYRKINQWTSHSRDMLETFKRYYNNSFLDGQRQEAYNLFLGNYVYTDDQPMLWDLPTDYHLHHADPRRRQEQLQLRRQKHQKRLYQYDHRDYIHWYTPENLRKRTLPPLPNVVPSGPSLSALLFAKHAHLKALPVSRPRLRSIHMNQVLVQTNRTRKHSRDLSNLTASGHHTTSPNSNSLILSKPLSYFDDYWLEFYRPYFLSSFTKMFSYKIKSTMKYIPIRSTRDGQYDLSPFKVRTEVGAGGEVDSAEKRRNHQQHKKEVSFAASGNDAAQLRLAAVTSGDDRDTASIVSGQSSHTVTAFSRGGSDTASITGNARRGGFQSIMKDGAFPGGSGGSNSPRVGSSSGGVGTITSLTVNGGAGSPTIRGTAAATTATTPATITSSPASARFSSHHAQAASVTSIGSHYGAGGSDGNQGSGYGNGYTSGRHNGYSNGYTSFGNPGIATTLDTTMVTNGGLLFEPDPRAKPKQSTLEKTRRAQWTFAKMVEGSLNPSVQETEDYERYIRHPQNLPLVVSDDPTGDNNVRTAGVTPITPRSPGGRSILMGHGGSSSIGGNEEYQEFVNGSWKTDALGLGMPSSRGNGATTPVIDDEMAMYGELLRVPENPLTVTEEDAQKKRYKAYRKWLRGKSLFKQQPVD